MVIKGPSLKKCLLVLSIGSILSLTFAIIGVAYWFQRPQANTETVVVIEKGAPLSQIVIRLSEQHILDFPFLFKSILLGTGQWRELKAGEYLIPAHITPAQLISLLQSGKVILHPITVVEGETSPHFANKLMNDTRFQDSFQVPPEGSLLPETYHFLRGTKRQDIIHHIQKEMQRVVAKLWAERPQNCLLKTPQEFVALASIIEKETSLARERPLIAAVFLNRIRLNMKLQADPTLVYALMNKGETLGRELSLEDLKIESPYNTYLYAGLPPTPISNPGVLSLKAVIHPHNVPHLYFVADGSGGHVFATTLKEHEQNHEAWRKIRAMKQKGEAR